MEDSGDFGGIVLGVIAVLLCLSFCSLILAFAYRIVFPVDGMVVPENVYPVYYDSSVNALFYESDKELIPIFPEE